MTDTFKKLLAYQDVDMQLREIEVACEQNEAFRLAAKARQNIINAKERIAQCEKKAEDILNAFNRAQAEYVSVTKKIAELKQDVEESDADDDVEYIIGVLKRTQESANILERDVNELQRQISEVTHTYNEARALTKKSKELFETKKQEYDKFFATKKSEIDVLKNKLSDMGKDIEPALMSKYHALRKEKKVPVVNKILSENGAFRCPRCRMEVDAATVDQIRQAGMGECDTCHFILYME